MSKIPTAEEMRKELKTRYVEKEEDLKSRISFLIEKKIKVCLEKNQSSFVMYPLELNTRSSSVTIDRLLANVREIMEPMGYEVNHILPEDPLKKKDEGVKISW